LSAHWRRPQALRSFVEGFAAASRRYAAQQVKWFRSDAKFEWVPADWERPERTEAHVLASIQCDRAEFDRTLAHARQAELRRINPAEGKAMRKYTGQLAQLSDEASFSALLRRADACCERLQPVIDELRAADEEVSRRFPFHSRKRPAADDGGGGGASANDDAGDELGEEGVAGGGVGHGT